MNILIPYIAMVQYSDGYVAIIDVFYISYFQLSSKLIFLATMWMGCRGNLLLEVVSAKMKGSLQH